MRVSLADVMRGRHGRSSRHVMRMPVRDRAVQREKNRVRCRWLRRHARAVQRNCDEAWHPWRWWCPLRARTRFRDHVGLPRTVIDRQCNAVARSQGIRPRTRVCTRTNTAIVMSTCGMRGAPEPRERFATDGRLRRRSSPDRDTGVSRCPCGVWVSVSRAGDRDDDARSLRFVGTCDEIPFRRRHRSASCDPRRWPARIGIHPVRPGRVPSSARACHGGAPA
jgi:hypothetical protein